jgi:hypothetical protein
MMRARVPQHALSARGRELAREVVAATERIVDHALARCWPGIEQETRRRRALLGRLELECAADTATCVRALRSAVLESERLLEQMTRCSQHVDQRLH